MMTHAEISELLGAYALDAVDGDEVEEVRAHLDTCPRCADEVHQHREAAAALAFAGERAPEGLWDRIQTRLEDTPPPLDMDRILPSRASARARARARAGGSSRASGASGRRWTRVAAGVAAA